MQISSKKQVRGLDINSNPLSVQKGMTLVAENIFVNRDNMIGNRKGYTYTDGGTNVGGRVARIFDYQGGLIIHTRNSLLKYRPSGDSVFHIYGDVNTFFKAPADYTMKATGANGNFYFTSDVGVQRLSKISEFPVLAGTPAALDLTIDTTGTTGFLSGNTQVGYQWVLVRTDSQGTPTSGAPSPMVTLGTNAAHTFNVAVSFSLPADVAVGDLWQLYRTRQTADRTVAPDASVFLVTQGTVTQSNIDAGFISLTDTAADSLLQAELYTNPNVETISAANYRPPLARDVATWQDYTFYANTSREHSLSLTLAGTIESWVNGTSALTITDADGNARTYTAAASENVAAHQFQNFAGFSDAATNRRLTVASLVRVINRDPGGFVYASDVTAATDIVRHLTLTARRLGSVSFSVTAANSVVSTTFQPAVPLSGTTLVSDDDHRPNRVMYAKIHQPDAVPLLNYVDVGQKDKRIERIIALRQSLFILKEDGIFYLTGLQTPFYEQQLNLTTYILAPDSAVPMSDQIFALTNQGVVSFSENGVAVVSRNIEPAITAMMSWPNLRTTAFAARHESQRAYHLFLPGGAADDHARVDRVYNIFRQEWFTHTKPATAAFVQDSTRTMFLGSGDENALLQERNSGTDLDYADEDITARILVVSGDELTVLYSSALATLDEGWAISQNNGLAYAKVLSATALGNSQFRLKMDRVASFTIANCVARRPINSFVLFPPDPCSEVALTKIFIDVTFALAADSISACTVYIGVNENQNFYTVKKSKPLEGWGMESWGTFAWGQSNPAVHSVPLRENVPINTNTGEWIAYGFRHAVADEPYFITYVDVSYNDSTDLTSADASNAR